jgi:hypothetical protein
MTSNDQVIIPVGMAVHATIFVYSGRKSWWLTAQSFLQVVRCVAANINPAALLWKAVYTCVIRRGSDFDVMVGSSCS